MEWAWGSSTRRYVFNNKQSWKAQVIMMEDRRYPKAAIMYYPVGRWCTGRPRKSCERLWILFNQNKPLELVRRRRKTLDFRAYKDGSNGIHDSLCCLNSFCWKSRKGLFITIIIMFFKNISPAIIKVFIIIKVIWDFSLVIVSEEGL